jgi:transcriptional regulator with XRE-family HTH domain
MATYYVLEQRLAVGWSRSKLARLAGMSPRLLGRLERGETPWKIPQLEACAAALDVPVATLYTPEPSVPEAPSVAHPQRDRPRETHRLWCACGRVALYVVLPRAAGVTMPHSLRDACNGWMPPHGGQVLFHREEGV